MSASFRIMQKDSCNIFENFSESRYRKTRQAIISMVLGTDMAMHFKKLDLFRVRCTGKSRFEIENDNDKKSLLDLAVHWADVSNPNKPP